MGFEKEPSAVINLVAYADMKTPRAIELFYGLCNEVSQFCNATEYYDFIVAIQAILNNDGKE